MAVWEAILWFVTGAAIFIACVGLGWLAHYWWARRRRSQQGWPTTEKFRQAQPHTWQAQHRKKYDRHRRKPVRQRREREAKVHKPHIRTRREN